MVPGLIDTAIRRLGYDGQETDSAAAAALREPTMFAPSMRASGARGPFDEEAHGLPWLDWIGSMPGWMLTSAGLFVLAILVRLWWLA